MTDSEKLDFIIAEMQGIKAEIGDIRAEIGGMKTEIGGMKAEIGGMKTEIGGMKAEIGGIKADIGGMKTEIGGMKADIQGLGNKVASLELHLENGTDKNIQLLAENFVELTKKLNQAIPVADKNLAYEIKVNYLVEEVDKLKKEVVAIKEKIA